jgi:hypothetical protein
MRCWAQKHHPPKWVSDAANSWSNLSGNEYEPLGNDAPLESRQPQGKRRPEFLRWRQSGVSSVPFGFPAHRHTRAPDRCFRKGGIDDLEADRQDSAKGNLLFSSSFGSPKLQPRSKTAGSVHIINDRRKVDPGQVLGYVRMPVAKEKPRLCRT